MYFGSNEPVPIVRHCFWSFKILKSKLSLLSVPSNKTSVIDIQFATSKNYQIKTNFKFLLIFLRPVKSDIALNCLN